MKLSQLLANSNVDYRITSRQNDSEISSITFDSRKATHGAMFFCLIGSLSDGHSYASNAYKNGCRVFAVSKFTELPEDAIVVEFTNSRQALAHISATFFGNPAKELKLIGITGTKGKTSVANMVFHCLNSAGVSCGYIGTSGIDYSGIHCETQNTTPESLELHKTFRNMVDCGIKACVIEVSSQALFNYRVDGIEFLIGVFTNLSPDHIGPTEHPNFEHYKNCKKKLFSMCKYGIFNADDEYFPDMINSCACSVTTYAVKNSADYTAKNIKRYFENGKMGVSFELVSSGTTSNVKLPIPGEFSVFNTLATFATVKKLGICSNAAIYGVETVSIKGRFEIVPLCNDRIFVIDYAHNEISMRTLLKTVRSYNPKRIVTVFGSVGDRTKNRRRDLGIACNELSDFSVITSDNPGCENPESIIDEIAAYFTDSNKFIKISDRTQAIRYAVRNSKPGDAVLLCGKGHENFQLCGKEKVPFCERDILISEKNNIK